MHEFAELHVVSDLHLGGESSERQIFKQGAEFGDLILELLRRPYRVRQGLVINGDLVDFLAEPNATYFDVNGASEKLDRILDDSAFMPVWEGLRQYIRGANHTLVITLGNHDLELAIPSVQNQLRQELSQGQLNNASRIVFAFEREGYRCQVGSKTVQCVHGNEVDPWNATDFAALKRVCADLKGQEGKRWIPNGGTQLVIDVMNEVKKGHPFVDLLKPEEGAVIPTLTVLDPALIPKAANAMPSWFRSSSTKFYIATGMLGLEEESKARLRELTSKQPSSGAISRMLGDSIGVVAPQGGALDVEGLLQLVERRFLNGIEARTLVATCDTGYLGTMAAVWNAVSGRGEAEVLREALSRLSRDRSFELKTEDQTYRDLDRQIDDDVDVLLAGHTHLERFIVRGNGSGVYCNTGTWARLIQLTPAMLKNRASFDSVYQALKAQSMAALDAADDLVLLRPSVATVRAKNKGIHVAIEHLKDGKLHPVDRLTL